MTSRKEFENDMICLVEGAKLIYHPLTGDRFQPLLENFIKEQTDRFIAKWGPKENVDQV